MDRMLTLELVRVTERAAIAAAMVRGRGDEQRADQAAVDAMWGELNRLDVRGRIVVGEGERDDGAEALRRRGGRHRRGAGGRHRLRPARRAHALRQEPAELACRDRDHAARRAAQRAGRLHGEDRHRAGLPGRPRRPRRCRRPRRSSGSPRPRASSRATSPPASSTARATRALIEAVRSTGASIRLIGDGDVAGIIHTTDPDTTGIDIYLGSGGAPEGVLAAAALRCIGGQMCGRLILDSDEKRQRAEAHGLRDPGASIAPRIWRPATCSSRRPASPTATCSAASASTATASPPTRS